MSSSPSVRPGYWTANLRNLAILLSIWFLVSFGCGILFADALNAFRIPGNGLKSASGSPSRDPSSLSGVIFVYVR